MILTTENNRIFSTDESGKVVAEITFAAGDDNTYVIDHTFVDDSLRGQGAASKLVKAAVDEITARGFKVAATCSYAKTWLERHGY